MSTIPQAQIQSLADAASTLAQRLAETPATASFQADIAGLEVPMASLLDLADLVREGIVAPLQALLATGTDPDLASLQDALSRAPLAINLSSTLDGSTDHGIQWFEMTLHGDQISQSVVLTPEVPDGMQMDAITTELSAGLEGLFRIGIDLTPGLTPDQAVLVDTRQLEACAHIDSTVDDIPASWGSYALGTGSAAIRLDACISLNPPGGSSTWALGQLATLDIDQLFASTTSGDGFSIQLPFTLDMAGFSLPQGSVLSLELSTPSAFDPSALALTWPAITLEDGSPFDFSLLGSFSQSDFTGFLQQLAGLLRSLGDQLELPVIGTDLGDVLNLGLDIDNLLSALKNPDGSWRFNSLQELFGQMGDALGLPAGSLDLRWNPQQASLEWTLDYTRNTSASTPFDGSRFLPADSGMTMDAQGSASIDTSLNYHISGGIVASTGATALDSSTLLADLNQGGGIHRGLLDSAGQTDISFILANGSSISLDLDAAAAMTTLGDLLAWLNSASPLLQAALVDSALVLTDHSTGTATFSVQSPSAGGIQSMLPLSLGLWGASASSSGGGQSITGQILGQTPSYARFYLDTAAPLVEGSVTVEARVDGGLAAGPLTLAIDHGAMQASTQWSAGFNPYQDGDSSLLSFADLPAADPAALLAQSFSATRVEGYLQLRTSDALNAPLAINPADYSADPLTTHPDTSLVPFIQISLDENADDSSWAWQTGPSEKLASLFDQSLASFSWQDVPALLEQLFAGLEQTPLWDIPLPMTSMTLGDLIDLRGALGGLTLPDLADSLGSIDFAGLHARLEDGMQLALPSLNTGFPDLVPRFMGLLDSLEALSFSWDTITPGDPDLEAAFLSRLGAWTLNAQGLFDELSLASLNPSLTTFTGLLDTELQSLGSLSFSLEGLLDLLENALTLEVPGLIFEVNPRMDTSGAESLLLFDFYYGPDPTHPEVFTPITAPVSLAARELQGSPIQISSEGELAISVQPTLEATVAMHLGSRQVTVD
ncbi:MAG: hypothetical protein RIQ52_724, partial [Pseudomonadota bacterium]